MSSATNTVLKKIFPTIGEVQYKIATTPQEMEDALTLVFKEYAKRNLIIPSCYKSEIRISPCHLLPETRIFVGILKGEVVITLSTFLDSPLHLPLDSGYHDEFQALRDQGRNIGEAGYLAVKSGIFPRKKSLRNSLEKLNFVCTLFRMAMQYGLYHTATDDACFVTNPDPKRKFFKHFPVQKLGEVKNFGFDEMHVNPKPAIAKRLDFREIRHAKKNPFLFCKLSNIIFAVFLGGRMPDSIFKPRLHLSMKDCYYFFVKKSDVLMNLTPEALNHVLSTYNLTQDEYQALLKDDVA